MQRLLLQGEQDPGTQGPAIESELNPRSKGVRNPIRILIWIIAASTNYGEEGKGPALLLPFRHGSGQGDKAD